MEAWRPALSLTVRTRTGSRQRHLQFFDAFASSREPGRKAAFRTYTFWLAAHWRKPCGLCAVLRGSDRRSRRKSGGIHHLRRIRAVVLRRTGRTCEEAADYCIRSFVEAAS